MQNGNKEIGYITLINQLKENKDYREIHFKGRIIFKDADEENDLEGFYVFERIN